MSLSQSHDKILTFFDLASLDEDSIEEHIHASEQVLHKKITFKHRELGRIQLVKVELPTAEDILKQPLGDLNLHRRLSRSLQGDNACANAFSFSELQNHLARPLLGHWNVLFTPRSVSNADDLRRLTCIHVLNHIFRTRDLVIKNNTRVSQESFQPSTELHDQGFTRPKVLYLVPNRNACYRIVEELVIISKPTQQENRSRFVSSFSREGPVTIDASKPDDFKELFSGNNDDMFRLGLKFTKTSMKLFSQFYASDIIIASPLGLRRIMEGEKKTPKDFDFLSSLEIVVVDQADALQMQNWAHVQFIFEHINLIPEGDHGCDFSRVRRWYLHGYGKRMRQTIISAQYLTSEISSLFSMSRNIFGQIKICPDYNGTLDPAMHQSFIRLKSPSPTADGDVRLNFFLSIILPLLQRGRYVQDGGLLIVVPTYLEVIRIGSHFRSLHISFTSLHEYSSVPETSRSRSNFLSEKFKIMIYTERIHHFRRYVLKGVKHIFFYKLPLNPIFYTEILGFVCKSEKQNSADLVKGTLKALFSNWDTLQLERIVGKQRQLIMVTESTHIYNFP